jgi:hypothetical protein
MTPNELNIRILAACQATTPTRTRNRGILVAHWLRAVVASDAGVTNYASTHTVWQRRRVLQRAGLIPIRSATDLASIAEALGVGGQSRDPIVRLAWVCSDLGRVGSLRFERAGAYFGPLVADAAEILGSDPDTAKVA